MHQQPSSREPSEPKPEAATERPERDSAEGMPAETGGPNGPEPTRYGDWEKNGRCIDF